MKLFALLSLAGTALVSSTACVSSERIGVELETVRPTEGGLLPIAAPPPARISMHVSIFPEAITAKLDENLPRTGSGSVELLARQTIDYSWVRTPFQVRFDRGRVIVSTDVVAKIDFLGERRIDLRIVVKGEPVISPDYRAVMQSTEVMVKARGSVERVNQAIERALEAQISEALDRFVLDVRPLVEGLHARIFRPLPLPFDGSASGCAELELVAIESGPTVLAGGFERDLGLVVLPSVTLPCARTSTIPPSLPLLANVAALPTGPFTLSLPIAASYSELSRAIEAAIGGRLYFSKAHPGLFLEKPRVFASEESLVIRLLLGGRLDILGVSTSVSGELFFSGHPRLEDNQITVPDLELTPGSVDGLLRLKVLLDHASLREQARSALRLDLSERISAARDKLSKELTFDDGLGCVRAELLRSEISAIHPHASFLRINVTLSAQGRVLIPCRK